MEIGDTLYASTREEWRSWLEEHSKSAQEIWLISYRKSADQPSLPYDIAVKEALCFGWIDSTRKSLDEMRYVQRYTPRRAGSGFSQINKERLARLIHDGRVAEHTLAALGDVRPERYQIPDDITAALEANPEAWKNWLEYGAPYRRIRAAYVDSARARGEEFDNRLTSLVRRTAKGQQFGYGIEEFYTQTRTR